MPRAVHLAILDVVGGAPTLPAASLVRESGGWYTARRGGHVLHVYDAGRLVDGRAICALVGRPSVVAAAVAASSAGVGRALGSLMSAPLAVRRRWPHWRVDGEVTESVPGGGTQARALVGAVVTLPTPLPGTALPWTLGPLRVDALVGPALPATIAGHRDDEDAETGGPLIDGE